MDCGRIPEFESYDPSHAVPSLWAIARSQSSLRGPSFIRSIIAAALKAAGLVQSQFDPWTWGLPPYGITSLFRRRAQSPNVWAKTFFSPALFRGQLRGLNTSGIDRPLRWVSPTSCAALASCHLLTASECVERERDLCRLLRKAANRGADNCVPSRRP
jgi:hypothetical protein